MRDRYAWITDLNDEELFLLANSLDEYELNERKELAHHVRGYGHRLLLELLEEYVARKLEKQLFIQE